MTITERHRKLASEIVRHFLLDGHSIGQSDVEWVAERQADKARSSGFAAAKEMAAQVLDNEIAQRERTDIEHMEPIDKLAEAIRSLEDKP